MVLVVGAVEVLAVPAAGKHPVSFSFNFSISDSGDRRDLRWIQHIGTDATRARLGREALKVTPGIGARGRVVAAKVLAREAAEAALGLVQRLSALDIADEHAEALGSPGVSPSNSP